MPVTDLVPTDPVLLTHKDVRLSAQAHRLATAYVVSDIDSSAVRQHIAGDPRRWFDTRPMVDPRECAPETVDMATLALEYGVTTGILQRHPQQQHLVCVLART